MSINRESDEYRELKSCFELSLSPLWLNFLLPRLEKKINENRISIHSIDDGIASIRQQAICEYAKNLVQYVQSRSEEFKNLTASEV